MTSKEALYKILDKYETYHNIECCEQYFDLIEKDLERVEKLEKELKQTKSNFKNSQTHSKTHYKRLIDKYLKLEKENKDLKELYDFQSQLNLHRYKSIKELYEKNLKLEDENEKLKKTIEILEKQNEGQTISQEEYDLLKELL